nr:hypothetical protein [Tanacetum cinerariifolium]
MLHVLRVEMVINSPWMLSKNWLVEKQTAFGKDMSNSFMTDNLPKIFWNTAVVKHSGDVTRVGKGFLGVETPLFENMLEVSVRTQIQGVETPLFESMLTVRDVAEEVEAHVPAQGDDVQEPAAEEVATNVIPPNPTSPSPSSPVIPSSFPHKPPCPPQPQDAEGSSLLFQQVLDTCSALALRVEGLENDKAAQQLEIVQLKARVKKLEKINKGRIIVDMDQDEGIELVTDQEKDAEVEGRHADKQAEIYNIDLDHYSKVLSMQEDDTEV